MTDNRIILCMKWGTLYPAEYVNVLYRAVRANITGAFRFVCLTDDATGFEDGIESFPIPDIGLDEWHYYHGAWPKLSVFSTDLYGLSGRALFVDLDTVICDKLDDFFTQDGTFIALDSAPWRYKNAAPRTMSSIFAFTIGSLGWLVDKIRADRDAMVSKYIIEQDYLHGELPDIRYWPQDWLVSYKYHLRPPLIVDRFRGPHAPQPPARMVVFHGKPRPIDLIRPPAGNWDVFPHYGKGPVAWMQEYWTRNGGRI